METAFETKPAVKEELSSVSKEEAQDQNMDQVQSHTLALPSYARWFSLDSIHAIERASLPDFFTPGAAASPQTYMQYRRFIVSAYRLNPNEHLSFTAVRRSLVGDAGAILRVHKFLAKWGIINYQVNPESVPLTSAELAAAAAAASVAGGEVPIVQQQQQQYVVDIDTPRGMFPFESFKPSLEFPNMEKFKDTFKRTSNEDNEQEAKRVKIVKPDIDAGGWNEASLKLLIEGVTKHQSDWESVAQHVNNGKTPEECIIRFLQLPMEDKFLEENKDLLGPLKYLPGLSFNAQDNPIMATLAFLVKLVDPETAQKAVKAVKSEQSTEEEDREDPLEDIKTASGAMFGIISHRADSFASNEIKEMNKCIINIIQTQMKIIDVKLSKLKSLDYQYLTKERQMDRMANDLLQERMALYKYTNMITSKLTNAINILSEDKDNDNRERAQLLIQQAQEILSKPPKRQMNVLGGEDGEKEDNGSDHHDVKPVSLETPMLYRYWSG